MKLKARTLRNQKSRQGKLRNKLGIIKIELWYVALEVFLILQKRHFSNQVAEDFGNFLGTLPDIKDATGIRDLSFYWQQDVATSYGALDFEGPGAFHTQTFSLSPLHVFFSVKFGRSLLPNFFFLLSTKLFSINKKYKTNISYGLLLSLHLFLFLLIF